jgi:hypothetical protein
MVREVLRFNPPIEDPENEFHATPLGWATHGSENGWYCKSGNYPAVVEMLLSAGAKMPQKLSGTEQVQQVLRRYQSKKNR